MEVYNRFREEAGGHCGVAGITEEDRIRRPGADVTIWVVGDVGPRVPNCRRSSRVRVDRYRVVGRFRPA